MRGLGGLLAPLLAASLTLSHPLTTRNPSASFSRLIVFGDSFSDDGHGAWVASNGTWPADPAYDGHHFSNGPVWAQVVASDLGLDLHDLAAGGATANNSFVAGFTGRDSTIPVPAAADQILNFLSNDMFKSEDVIVHYIGANDPLFDTNVTAAQITSLIVANVDVIYRNGGRNIILANYPSLDTLPATYNVSSYAFAGNYSSELTHGLKNIASAYSAYLNIGIADIGALFDSIVSNPAQYGINPSYVHPPTPCLKGVYTSEGVPRSLCTDPSEHLFFDVYHPVKEVHKAMAEVFEKVIQQL